MKTTFKPILFSMVVGVVLAKESFSQQRINFAQPVPQSTAMPVTCLALEKQDLNLAESNINLHLAAGRGSIPGKKLKITGIILTSVGIPLLVGGGLIFVQSSEVSGKRDSFGQFLGILGAIPGVGLTATGIPLWIAGTHKMKKNQDTQGSNTDYH